MHYRSLLIVTYGRSGSTLLQGVLNSIDGVLVRGENMDFCWGLYSAWKSLVDAKNQPWSGRSNQPRNAWFGADHLSPDRLLVRARQLVIEQLAPGPGVRCIGFKEIRYLDHLQELPAYLKFLGSIFPQPAFIFNTREHSAVIKSAFWRSQYPKVLTQRLRRADHLFFAYAAKHPNAFIMRYETLIKGPKALSPLFTFLGVAPDEERLRFTLDTPHSFIPKRPTLERAIQAREIVDSEVSGTANPSAMSFTGGLVMDPLSPLQRVDTKVLVAAPIRNEITLLPWFLEYYRGLGCRAFLFIDNGSTDGSLDLLRQQDDVLLYQAPAEQFRHSRSGRVWVNALVRLHALHKWVLCVDIDELLCWPDHDSQGLQGLVQQAERLGLNRVFTPMIDAYSDQPTDQMPAYVPGTPFGDICPWVDPLETTKHLWNKGRLVLFGGPRNRFVNPGDRPPITSKQALYYVEENGYQHLGAHFDSYALPSPLVAVLLHYKFMPDFSARCVAYINEGTQWNNAQDYRKYQAQQLGARTFKTDRSIRVRTGHDLIGHISGISRLIRRRGFAGSIHLTHRVDNG